MPAIVNQGLTAIRNSLKTLITHVGISTDSTAFSATQTALNPSGAGTNLIKAATDVDVDFRTFDSSISVDGTTEFTGLNINTIGALNGSAASNVLSRSLRTNPIGVQSGDVFTIGVRVQAQDNS